MKGRLERSAGVDWKSMLKDGGIRRRCLRCRADRLMCWVSSEDNFTRTRNTKNRYSQETSGQRYNFLFNFVKNLHGSLHRVGETGEKKRKGRIQEVLTDKDFPRKKNDWRVC